jgi:hypothetical protein
VSNLRPDGPRLPGPSCATLAGGGATANGMGPPGGCQTGSETRDRPACVPDDGDVQTSPLGRGCPLLLGMGLRSWLRTFLLPLDDTPDRLSPLRVRRELARERAADTGGEPWTKRDTHPRPRSREVNDSGGLGMGIGGQRTIKDYLERRTSNRIGAWLCPCPGPGRKSIGVGHRSGQMLPRWALVMGRCTRSTAIKRRQPLNSGRCVPFARNASI